MPDATAPGRVRRARKQERGRSSVGLALAGGGPLGDGNTDAKGLVFRAGYARGPA